MNTTVKNSIMAVLAATLGLCASLAQAQGTSANRVYVIDGRGEVATSGTGLCVRTGFWTPAGAAADPAGCKCDKDLIAKEVCEPKVAAAPAAAPAAEAPAAPAAEAAAPAAEAPAAAPAAEAPAAPAADAAAPAADAAAPAAEEAKK